MSSQASYKTLLNFKATFEDFNLGLCNIVQQIHKTIKQKIAEWESESVIDGPTNQLQRIGARDATASKQWTNIIQFIKTFKDTFKKGVI